ELSAWGEVALDRFSPKRFDLQADLEEVSLRLSEDLPLTTSGHLALTGAPGALSLGGELEINRLRYTRGLEVEDLLRDLARARAAVVTRVAERPAETMQLAVGVRLGDVRVENNLAKAQLVGALMLTGTDARPGLLGSVQVAEGGVAYFRGNQFLLTE